MLWNAASMETVAPGWISPATVAASPLALKKRISCRGRVPRLVILPCRRACDRFTVASSATGCLATETVTRLRMLQTATSRSWTCGLEPLITLSLAAWVFMIPP